MNREEKIREKLKTIIDPHTGVDIVSMGLIKEIKVNGGKARITFVPTSPYCPITGFFEEQIRKLAESVQGVKGAEVEVELG